MTYERPRTVEETRSLLDEHGEDAKLVGGGQSFILLVRQGLLDPEVIVDISGVEDLSGVDRSDGTTEIGAATTYAEVASSVSARRFAGIVDAVTLIGDRQVRNMGTIGGAVAHADPAMDIVPPLLCFNANLRISSVDGVREIPLVSFLVGHMQTDLGANELVEAIVLPDPPNRTGSEYRKLSTVEGGWASVGTGCRVSLSPNGDRFEEVRLAFAGVGDTGLRTRTVEDRLANATVEESRVAEAAELVTDDIDPISDISGSLEYKNQMASRLAIRSIEAATTRAGGQL